MNGIIEKLVQIPEYQKLNGMLKQCRVLLKLKGEIYACRLKLYTMQFATGEIKADEYQRLVEELHHDIKRWLACDSSVQRWNMHKLISSIHVYIVDVLLDAILDMAAIEEYNEGVGLR